MHEVGVQRMTRRSTEPGFAPVEALPRKEGGPSLSQCIWDAQFGEIKPSFDLTR